MPVNHFTYQQSSYYTVFKTQKQKQCFQSEEILSAMQEHRKSIFVHWKRDFFKHPWNAPGNYYLTGKSENVYLGDLIESVKEKTGAHGSILKEAHFVFMYNCGRVGLQVHPYKILKHYRFNTKVASASAVETLSSPDSSKSESVGSDRGFGGPEPSAPVDFLDVDGPRTSDPFSSSPSSDTSNAPV